MRRVKGLPVVVCVVLCAMRWSTSPETNRTPPFTLHTHIPCTSRKIFTDEDDYHKEVFEDAVYQCQKRLEQTAKLKTGAFATDLEDWGVGADSDTPRARGAVLVLYHTAFPHGGLNPASVKVCLAIRFFQRLGHRVVTVSHDKCALEVADVGIAFGTMGAMCAKEMADGMLLTDNMKDLLGALRWLGLAVTKKRAVTRKGGEAAAVPRKGGC